VIKFQLKSLKFIKTSGAIVLKKLRIALYIVIVLWICGLFLISGAILVYQNDKWPHKSADAIICLGADMSFEGWEKAGPASARRALTCTELFEGGVAPLIVFTGYGHQRFSAAGAMAKLALDAGVPASSMIIEKKARSTIQNAAYSLALLPKDASRIVLVSDDFHLPRAKITFKLLGAPEIETISAKNNYGIFARKSRNKFAWVLRETFALWLNFGRMCVYFGAISFGFKEGDIIGFFN